MLQLLALPLQKLTPKANASIQDVGTIDSLVQSFGPYITGELTVANNKLVRATTELTSNVYLFFLSGTQLEDEDVLAKDVKNVDGRVVSLLVVATGGSC